MSLKGDRNLEVNEAQQLTCFYQVVAQPMYEEAKKRQGAHNSWASLVEALLDTYGYVETKEAILYKLNLWVSSSKTQPECYICILRFQALFCSTLKMGSSLVQINKVLTFVKPIHQKEMMVIGVQLEYDGHQSKWEEYANDMIEGLQNSYRQRQSSQGWSSRRVNQIL